MLPGKAPRRMNLIRQQVGVQLTRPGWRACVVPGSRVPARPQGPLQAAGHYDLSPAEQGCQDL